MAIDTASPRSRRALLAAVLGAGAATVASALGRPAQVRGATGDSLTIGKTNYAENPTFLSQGSTFTGNHLLRIDSLNEPGGLGLWGRGIPESNGTVGVKAESLATGGTGLLAVASGAGAGSLAVDALSSNGTGVRAEGLGHGVDAISTAGSGGRGVRGQSAPGDASGVGVLGSAPALSGSTIGVYGTVGSPSGTGVRGDSANRGVEGYATAASGAVAGVHGQTGSTSGAGVNGYATATSGANLGVKGETNSSGGLGVLGVSPYRGVEGRTKVATGAVAGVHGQTASTAGAGVNGYATAASGVTFGVKGETVSSEGIGVYGVGPTSGLLGRATHTTNEVYGVYGETVSPAGRGLFGRALTTSSGTGVLGQADGPTGFGVRGISYDTDAATGKFGTAVMGVAGVHAKTSWPAARANTGVWGHSPNGTGVYASASTGYALRTSGRIRVDKASGVATIPTSATAITVTPGLDITTASFVLLTPRSDPGSRRIWYTVDTAANTFTISVNSAVPTPLGVGWLLLG